VTQGDPTRSIHVAAKPIDESFLDGGDMLPRSVTQDDLESRAHSWDIINAAWCLLAFLCGVAMVAIGVPLRVLFGSGIGNFVICAGLGATFFCLAGCANALGTGTGSCLRRSAERARALSRPDYEASWRRTLPRTNSVAFQAAVAFLTVVTAASNLYTTRRAVPR
jgi:hypothetical protein